MGHAVESGSQQVGAVTVPQSLQESCFPHTIAVSPLSIISPGLGRRGKETPAEYTTFSPEPWPSLLFELISAIFRGTVGWDTGLHKDSGLHGTVVLSCLMKEG